MSHKLGGSKFNYRKQNVSKIKPQNFKINFTFSQISEDPFDNKF